MDACSVCKAEFNNTEAYLEHICKTGFRPTEIKHQIRLNPNYEKISKGALERGKKL